MKDPYLDDLKGEFDGYSNQLKKLKKKLLKSNSTEEQSKIIKEIDSIANKMENNQKQSVKVTKSRIKERKKNLKDRIIQHPILLLILLSGVFCILIHHIHSLIYHS